MPRRQHLVYSGSLVQGQCLGAIFGSIWASFFLIWTSSTMMSFVPFIGVAIVFVTVLMTCLRNRLLPHAYFCIKKQEQLLKKHLLERKNAESFHNRRYGQEPAIPTYYESLDSAELVNPYPVCISQDQNMLISHRSIVSQVQRTSANGMNTMLQSQIMSQSRSMLRSNYRSGTLDSSTMLRSQNLPNHGNN